MPYIGRGISQLQTIDKLDAITPSTSTGAGPYNLTQSSSAFTPISANNLLISINGVVQYGNFTVSGSTVTFTGALSDSDTCNFILHVGEGVVNTPAAGTVTWINCRWRYNQHLILVQKQLHYLQVLVDWEQELQMHN